MNSRPVTRIALERAAAKQLAALLESIPWIADVEISFNAAPANRPYDLLARFKPRPGLQVELWVEVQAEPRPSRFPYVALEREFGARRTRAVRAHVLAAPYLSQRMADVCEQHGWSWFDLAGNFRISIPEVLHFQHTGNSPKHPAPKSKANLGTREASRIIRALLTPVFTGQVWTQRALQAQCMPSTSLGLVNKVVQHLKEEAFVKPLQGGGFRLSDPENLLIAWRDAYRLDQHEQLAYFTLLQGKRLHEALAKAGLEAGGALAYASFSAAEFQAPYVRQPRTWLYVASRGLDRWARAVEAKPVDSGENLVVLIPSDDGVFFHQTVPSGQSLPHTDPVQTYVDLWHSGGRGREAADALLEQCLRPLWKTQGIPE